MAGKLNVQLISDGKYGKLYTEPVLEVHMHGCSQTWNDARITRLR
jgi:hypothetical protein